MTVSAANLSLESKDNEKQANLKERSEFEILPKINLLIAKFDETTEIPEAFITFYTDSLLLHDDLLQLDSSLEPSLETIESRIETSLSTSKTNNQDHLDVYLTIFKYIKVLTKIESCLKEIETKNTGFRERYRQSKDRKKQITMLRRGMERVRNRGNEGNFVKRSR